MPEQKPNLKNFINLGYSRGQTLIETMVAIFILVMGVSAAVGLAIYAFNSSTNITKEMIATGLAREGVEAVANMRDTNWLKDTLVNSCYNYMTSSPTGGNCYKNWLDMSAAGGYKITAGTYSLRFDLTTPGYWVLDPNAQNFALDRFDLPNGSGNTFTNFATQNAQGESGFYSYPTSYLSSGSSGSSDYYRQIVITQNTASQFSQPNFSELKVDSHVWWTDKGCPRVSTYTPGMKCSVSLQTNLTNWKDY